jgi:hypothetical protein
LVAAGTDGDTLRIAVFDIEAVEALITNCLTVDARCVTWVDAATTRIRKKVKLVFLILSTHRE